MISFETALTDAKTRITLWSEAGTIQEATLVRDAKGKVSVYLSPIAGQNFTDSGLITLKNDLCSTLNSTSDKFFSERIYVKNEEWTKDLFKRLEELRVLDPTPGSSIQWYTVERGISKKAWVQCNGTENAAWHYDMTQSSAHPAYPKIVTFFSYKGGMGRTTALVASALELIRRKKNVLMIDTDLEAPGLSTFFFPEGDTGYVNKGTVDYLLAKNKDANASQNMSDYILTLNSPNYRDTNDGNLYLVCGGKLDNNFLPKLARIDSQELVEGRLKYSLTCLLDDCRNAVPQLDYIFIDSRAGFHDMAGIVTAQLPHGVVLFGKNSYQSWFGIEKAIKTIAKSQSDLPFAIIADSGCGQNGIVSNEEKASFRKKSHEVFFNEFYPKFYPNESPPVESAEGVADDPVFIPYIPILSQDIPLYDTTKAPAILNQMQSEPYKKLTDRIMTEFGDVQGGGSDNNG